MKIMKKSTVLILTLSFIATVAFAQNPGTAKLSYDAGKLNEAKEQIDKAIENEKHAAKSKTWYFRGLIYAGIASDQTGMFKKLDDNPIQKAYDAFMKAMELEPEKKGSYDDAQKAIKDILHPSIINWGVAKYQDDDISAALDAFVMAQKTNPADTLPYMYAADLAYQLEKFDVFKSCIQKVISQPAKNKIRYYAYYAFYLRDKEENNEEALKILNEGLKQDKTLDRENYKLLQDMQLDLYIKTNKMEEAISEIKKTIDADPKNAKNYLNLGILLEKVEKPEDALKAYEKSIELDPTHDAIFNAGALFYNKGAKIIEVVNQMPLQEYNQKGKAEEEKAAVEFKKALPYFERLYKMDSKDSQVLRPLFTLYQSLKMKDQADKISKEMEALFSEE